MVSRLVGSGDCDKCGLCEQVQTVCVPGRRADVPLGAAQAEFVVPPEPGGYFLVGEAPGADEDRKGTAFIGTCGQLLQRILATLTKSGLDLERVWISNAVRCRPPGNGNPSMKQKRACRPWLDEEIELLQPAVIVVMGDQAWQAIRDDYKARVGRDRMKVFMYTTTSGREIPMVCTSHPAAPLYDRAKLPQLVDDLYAYLVKETWQEQPSAITTRLINTRDHWLKLIRRIEAAKVIGLDIETVGFSPQLVTVAVTFPEKDPYTAYVVPVNHPESTLPPDAVAASFVQAIVRNPNLLVYGHNAAYDLSRIAMNQVGTRPVLCRSDDSMIFHYMLDEHAKNRTLKYLARRYTTEGGYEMAIDMSKLISTPLPTVARYNGIDAALPYILCERLTGVLKEQLYYSEPMIELNRRMTPWVATLEAVGMKVDGEELDRLAADFEEQREARLNELQEMAPDVNPGSPKQLSAYLYGAKGLGLTVPHIKGAVTKTGQLSTQEEVVQHLDHPYVDLLLEWRGLHKTRNTYLESLYTHRTPAGLVHPDYFIAKSNFGGTVSGRLAAKNPPVHSLIMRGHPIRKCFVSRWGTDGVLIANDASQMELRYAGMESGDLTLMEMFRDPLADAHQATADICGVERQTGKKVNFAAIYGVSAAGLVEKAGLELAVAKKIASKLRKAWARLYEWEREIEEVAIVTGETRTPYGRVRREPGGNRFSGKGRHKLRELVNFRVQGPASDFVQLWGWLAMTMLDGLALPILSKHDEVVWDTRKENLPEVLDILVASVLAFPKLVEDVLGMTLTIPFIFDTNIGPNLLEMEEGDPMSTVPVLEKAA